MRPNQFTRWPAWTNSPVVLYHGTNDTSAHSIVILGVDLRRSEPNKDFGRGFYTTTRMKSAELFADRRVKRSGGLPAVVALEFKRSNLSALKTLAFVRGTLDAEDFWSFVQHCRTRM
jgi:hypothetical protein